MANPDKFVLGPGFRGIIRRYGGDLAPELTAAGTSPNPHARTIEICFDDVEERIFIYHSARDWEDVTPEKIRRITIEIGVGIEIPVVGELKSP